MSVSMVGSTSASMGVGTRGGALSTNGGVRSADRRQMGAPSRVASYLCDGSADGDQGAMGPMVIPGSDMGSSLAARFSGARGSPGQGPIGQHRLTDGDECRGHRGGLSGDYFESRGDDAGYDAKTLSSLEEPPRTRPVVAQQSLRCIRAVENLTELDGSGSHPINKDMERFEALACDSDSPSTSAGSSRPSWSEDGDRDGRSSVSSAHPSTSSLEGSVDGGGIPVYVMLPLDCVTSGGLLKYVGERWFKSALMSLRASGCKGVMVDVWWGAVERKPRVYDWSPYLQLIKAVKGAGLKMQVVFSFHACGSNVGDTCSIPLPKWVLVAGAADEDIFFTDRPRDGEAEGQRNRECLSIWADREPVLDGGRTPLECYEQFMASFRDAVGPELGSTITEVCVGTGPCGELRYPSYPMHSDRGSRAWNFPGVGEFQCYDRYALAHLAAAAGAVGRSEWGRGAPSDAGSYNSRPEQTGFFGGEGGGEAGFTSEYGRFFLEWYSGCLLGHGDRMLKAAASVFGSVEGGRSRAVDLSLKCAGVHWWYNAPSHAAELTAGYYNVEGHCGYGPILDLCRSHGARLIFTCVEMCDEQHPPDAACGPEGLLRQVRAGAARRSVGLAGENALPCHSGEGRFNADAMGRIVRNSSATMLAVPASPGPSRGSRVISYDWEAAEAAAGGDADVVEVPPMVSFTFLRLAPDVVDHPQRAQWDQFVDGMSAPCSPMVGSSITRDGSRVSLARDGSQDSLSSASSTSSRSKWDGSSSSSAATHAPESPVVSVLGAMKAPFGAPAAAAAKGRGGQLPKLAIA